MKKALCIFVLMLGCDQSKTPMAAQADLERNVARQDQARVEAQQGEAWQVMDDALGLAK